MPLKQLWAIEQALINTVWSQGETEMYSGYKDIDLHEIQAKVQAHCTYYRQM